MKCGLHIVDRPLRLRYRWRHRDRSGLQMVDPQAKAFVARIAPLLADEPRFKTTCRWAAHSAIEVTP
jgi:hypothetical protein